jgi:hypothetical protein
MRLRAMSTSCGEMSIATTSAPRRASSSVIAPGAAARIEHAAARQVLGQARQHDRAHPVAALAHRLANARHRRIRGQPLPRVLVAVPSK